MDKFEILDEEIKVEEIMQKIREGIKRWKESGESSELLQENRCLPPEQAISPPMEQDVDESKNDLLIWADKVRRDLDYINSNWDIQNDSYFISSHRPHTGKFLIKGRELVHGEVKRYVDPMIWKQREFNERIARTLNETTKMMYEISQTVASALASLKVANEKTRRIPQKIIELENVAVGEIKTEMGSKIDEQIGLVKAEICNEVATQVRAVVTTMNQEIENRAWLANILDKKRGRYQDIEASLSTQELGLNYFLFEEKFRGSRADIKQRQTAFIHCFEGCKNVLDIGSGRGEFLELVREQGIDGKGVDVDEEMVNFCKSRGLDVELIDAVSYLEKIEDKSLDGIFIDQVVEHLEPNYLIKMIGLSYDKLIYGGTIVVETVNPLSFASFVNFYIDMSHKRPVHPETLKFILESAGFREIETKFLAQVPEEVRLRKIDIEYSDEKDKRLIENYNHNIDVINNVLFGAQDYAVIGKK